jgi:hypothetical protein
MLKDLIYYYKNRSDVLTEDDWKNPSGATIFAKKIVAAHYLQLVDYIKVMLPSLEVAEQEQWKALQTTSRRCGNYRDDIEDTLLSLDYTLGTTMPKRSTDWRDCERDYQYIYFRLQILKERTDNLMSSMTGLASIAGTNRTSKKPSASNDSTCSLCSSSRSHTPAVCSACRTNSHPTGASSGCTGFAL